MKAQPRGLGFDFPLAFTMTHMFFSLAGCSLVMLLRPSQRRLDPRVQLPKYWPRLLCLSFFYVLAIAANNMSLMNVGLSINQVRPPSMPYDLAAAYGPAAFAPQHCGHCQLRPRIPPHPPSSSRVA